MENKLNLTPELLEQAKAANSAAALLSLAQENGITLTAEQAAEYYAQLHPEMGAIADEELDNVSGSASGYVWSKCSECGFIAYVPESYHICQKCGYDFQNWCS